MKKWIWIEKKYNGHSLKRAKPKRAIVRWGINVRPLPSHLKNYVISRYYIGKLSERALNIVLHSNSSYKYSVINNNFLTFDPYTKEVCYGQDWESNIKNTILSDCATCGNEIRLNYLKFSAKNFQCDKCIKNKRKIPPQVYLIRTNELKRFSEFLLNINHLDYIDYSKESKSLRNLELEIKQNASKSAEKYTNFEDFRNFQKKTKYIREKKRVRLIKKEIIKNFLKSKKLL